MDDVPDNEYLRTFEVAAELGGVSPKTVTRWAKAGKLPYLWTLGGHRRYPAAAIRELAATLSHQPEEATDDLGSTADRLPGEEALSDPDPLWFGPEP
jgi:excisionase family DNA binding protein